MAKKKLNAKQYAQRLFLESKILLKDLRLTKKALPLGIVSAATLTIFRLFPLINRVVSEKENSQFFEKMLKEYERLLKKWYLGEDVALIKTAVPLTIEEEDELNERLANIFGRYFKLDIEVDPDLIGGIIVKIGDKIIDRSILGKLKKLQDYIQS